MLDAVDYRSRLYPYRTFCPECGDSSIVHFIAGQTDTVVQCKRPECDGRAGFRVTRPQSETTR